jgi:hypothetical protein
MNSARIEKSLRLQTLLQILATGKEYSTAEIEDAARALGRRLCAVHSCAAELRDRGVAVSCQRRGHLWFYRLGK